MSNINAEKYVSKNKVELLRLYSAIYSGIELGSFVFDDLTEENLEKISSRLTVLSHKHLNSKLIFNFPKDYKFSKVDDLLFEEFHSIILCEKQVQTGNLERDGDFYIAKDFNKCKSIPRYKKYIKSK